MRINRLGATATLGVLALLQACSGQDEGQEQDSATATTAAVEPADFVFTNGEIYTVDDDNPMAEAVLDIDVLATMVDGVIRHRDGI